jgi:hypothetical protein
VVRFCRDHVRARTRRVSQRWGEALFEAIGAEVVDVSAGR